MLTVAGLHVPVIPFCDEVGNVGAVPPEHIPTAGPKLNVGVTRGMTFTLNVKGVAH